jgi:Uma2 family endonuclease
MPSYLPHYRYADYCRWQGDWELYGGIPIAMTPSPFGRHQQCLTRLVLAIGGQLAGTSAGYETLVELDWVVDDDTVVRPDLVVIAGDIPETHLRTAPLLAVEIVSPSSRERDTTYKVDLYRRHSVQHYLIIDPDDASIEHHDNVGQTSRRMASGTLEVPLSPDQRIDLDLDSLFHQP